MFENIEHIKENYLDLEKKMIDPDVLADISKLTKITREYNSLKPIVEKYDEIKDSESTIAENKELIGEADDQDMVEMLKDEIKENEKLLEKYKEEMKILLIPKDPNDSRDVIVEIRPGAGGDEAGLFAGDLYRMYHMYADKEGYKTEDVEVSSQGVGGIKEATFMIRGEGAYSRFKYESGVHRVQRVPETESGGRIHTSTATVAVLPEVDEVDVELDPNDIRTDVFRSSGNGGQSVNTTDSAVRLTHIPTGIVVSMQDEKSQIKNKEKAMKILLARIYELEEEKRNKEIADNRKSQVGTGDRSERIRTYNFPQGRITDHRINKTIYQLDDFLNGNIGEMIDSLIAEDQTRKLEKIGEEE
ncbi:Peptide chain release factor 1 [Anaerococcus prevotii]|uniref:Peptide chain release factor 1 n=1 Tax=Anaerococcus prevotii (strain ATCC 9321 / DSM 20548 / JCM 6508 / NCTC 11806 / PC1) TaxID=525919 RepID=C7RH20_ANAPD|nr:peptide chain release factor 1 [Anaerococcus prevotii]ACV28781.1 peptide chain release factor 1 [Anaerococcus prevotii DSM 20548]MDU2557492.1 peptide chain release factor 1 [Anaerococcus prevotii]MDU2584522.1 peptide chain release factor 1 [Anaerococcus prevotii]SUU94456.1 Peptide chain release factor 1 [Anaerococcus prevotii]